VTLFWSCPSCYFTFLKCLLGVVVSLLLLLSLIISLLVSHYLPSPSLPSCHTKSERQSSLLAVPWWCSHTCRFLTCSSISLCWAAYCGRFSLSVVFGCSSIFLVSSEETQPIRKVKHHYISIILLGFLIQYPVHLYQAYPVFFITTFQRPKRRIWLPFLCLVFSCFRGWKHHVCITFFFCEVKDVLLLYYSYSYKVPNRMSSSSRFSELSSCHIFHYFLNLWLYLVGKQM
jgi:hypothetical protein